MKRTLLFGASLAASMLALIASGHAEGCGHVTVASMTWQSAEVRSADRAGRAPDKSIRSICLKGNEAGQGSSNRRRMGSLRT